MSYPRTIHTLIVEDEQDAKENYAQIFQRLGKEYDLAPPVYARSYEAGASILEGADIFHLVILDLNLPMQDRSHPATDDLGYGLGLVEDAARRDRFPIPGILVISGFLRKTRINEINERLNRCFWHGRLVNKGLDDEEEKIQDAIKAIQTYCDIGIHIKQIEQAICPPLTPREEDLLRRCVLNQECIGVVLEWWSADFTYSSKDQEVVRHWTKVLMGNLILKEGLGSSHPTFFKFEPVFHEGYNVIRDVNIMQQKLPHIKKCCNLASHDEHLLVTQKVGASRRPPVPLSHYLKNEVTDSKQLSLLLNDVFQQLQSLGDVSQDLVPISTLFWPGHDYDRIRRMWQRFQGDVLADELKLQKGPDEYLHIVKSNRKLIWVQKSRCTHGDLNPTNIAVDEDADRMRAYIFDAAGIHAHNSAHDLAYLEITSLLHHQDPNVSLVKMCAHIYCDSLEQPDIFKTNVDLQAANNVINLVKLLREKASTFPEPELYLLALFDCALMQLGGLDFGISNNHISNPADAALLTALIMHWIETSYPSYFN